MIYARLSSSDPLNQGEIIDQCPLLGWDLDPGGHYEAASFFARVIVLTQACDLDNPAKQRVTVAVVHRADDLVACGVLTGGTIRDHARRHRTYGWYFLPAGDNLPESLVDLHDLHSVPRGLLEQLANDGQQICRLVTPYREHLSQHFAVTYSRIGLPEPYERE